MIDSHDPTHATEHHQQIARLLGDAVWEALVADPSIGVAILREDSSHLFCNDRYAEFFFGSGAKARECHGLGWARELDKEVVHEARRILGEVVRTAKPTVVRCMIRGHQLYAMVIPMPSRGAHLSQALSIMRRVPGHGGPPAAPGYHVIEAATIDLGALAVLSSRELEVLALLGQGLSSKEIGKILTRSEKTVENHRYSISRKLSGATSVELAEIARQAGLTLADAGRRTRRTRPGIGRATPRARNRRASSDE